MATIPWLYADTDHPILGLWCDECQLPGGVEFPLLGLSMEGVGELGSIVTCLNCGDFDDDEEADD